MSRTLSEDFSQLSVSPRGSVRRYCSATDASSSSSVTFAEDLRPSNSDVPVWLDVRRMMTFRSAQRDRRRSRDQRLIFRMVDVTRARAVADFTLDGLERGNVRH